MVPPDVSGTIAPPGVLAAARRLPVAIVAVIAGLTIALGAVFATVPWPFIDLHGNLENASTVPWTAALRDAFGRGVEYRPMLTLGTKLAYAAAGLHEWEYQLLVLLLFAGVLVCLARILAPAGRWRVIGALLAIACAVALPSSRIFFLFLPLNGYSIAMLLVLVAAVRLLRPAPRFEWLLPLTWFTLLWLETGVLIVALAWTAWLLRAPGATWRSVAAATVGFVLYAAVRLTFGGSLNGLTPPESGLGFDDLSGPQLTRIFEHAPWVLWVHNVAATFLTVFASEPRGEKFKFIASLLKANADTWQWLHVGSSLLTSVVVIVTPIVAGRLLPERDRLVMALAWVLILGGSALGFLYTCDRIAFPVALG